MLFLKSLAFQPIQLVLLTVVDVLTSQRVRGGAEKLKEVANAGLTFTSTL